MAKAVFLCENNEEEIAIKMNDSKDLRFIARSLM